MGARSIGVVRIRASRGETSQVGQHPAARQPWISFLGRGAGVPQFRGHRQLTHQSEEIRLALRSQRPCPTPIMVRERVCVRHRQFGLPEPTQPMQRGHHAHLPQGNLLVQAPHLRVTTHERRRRTPQVPDHRLRATHLGKPIPHTLPEFTQPGGDVRLLQRLGPLREPRLQIDVMMPGHLRPPARVHPGVRALHLHEVHHRDRVTAHRHPGLQPQVLLELPLAVRRVVVVR